MKTTLSTASLLVSLTDLLDNGKITRALEVAQKNGFSLSTNKSPGSIGIGTKNRHYVSRSR